VYTPTFKAGTPVLDVMRELISQRAISSTVAEILKSRFTYQMAEEKRETLTCWNCGKNVPMEASYKYCPHCGALLKRYRRPKSRIDVG